MPTSQTETAVNFAHITRRPLRLQTLLAALTIAVIGANRPAAAEDVSRHDARVEEALQDLQLSTARELIHVAGALRQLDQSYAYRGFMSTSGGRVKAFNAGSAYSGPIALQRPEPLPQTSLSDPCDFRDEPYSVTESGCGSCSPSSIQSPPAAVCDSAPAAVDCVPGSQSEQIPWVTEHISGVGARGGCCGGSVSGGPMIHGARAVYRSAPGVTISLW